MKSDIKFKIILAQLKEKYGKSPNTVNVNDLTQRYDTLAVQLEQVISELGGRPAMMRATHKVNTSHRRLEELEQHANVKDDLLRKAPLNTIEGITNLLDKNAQYLTRAYERNEVMNRSATEWRKLEREYTVRSSFTIMDFYSDFKDTIESKTATWDDYRKERRLWKHCKHRFCQNMFPISKDNFKRYESKRGDSKFCCDSCRYDEKYSVMNYLESKKVLKNPTYLPSSFYISVTDDWAYVRQKQNEIATEQRDIEMNIISNRPIRKNRKQKEEVAVNPIKTRFLTEVSIEELEKEKWQESRNIRRISEEFVHLL